MSAPGFAGLSLEQAPPISAPFRFFLSAPLFLAAAGLLLLIHGEDVFASRWAGSTLAVTHLITLGFLALVMCGALTQMLPVLAGAPIPGVRRVAAATHGLLASGTAALVWAFMSEQGAGLMAASVLLGAGFGILVIAAILALTRAQGVGAFVVGVRAALTALVVTAGLGVILVLVMAGYPLVGDPIVTTNLHLTWGVVGWVGFLLIAVAYQVVPMFHVTPEYPAWMRRTLVPLLFGLLVLGSLLFPLTSAWRLAPLMFALFGVLLFAAWTWRLLSQQRRKISDLTVRFWRLGLICVGVGLGLWFAERIGFGSYPLAIGVAVLLGGAVSLVNGMLYKIVPFLSWFHLQTRQVRAGRFGVRIPSAAMLLPRRAARIQFHLHLAACVALFCATIWPELVRIGGALLSASALLLAWNLVQATWRYHRASLALEAAGSS